jgi:hypothetical protein
MVRTVGAEETQRDTPSYCSGAFTPFMVRTLGAEETQRDFLTHLHQPLLARSGAGMLQPLCLNYVSF